MSHCHLGIYNIIPAVFCRFSLSIISGPAAISFWRVYLYRSFFTLSFHFNFSLPNGIFQPQSSSITHLIIENLLLTLDIMACPVHKFFLSNLLNYIYILGFYSLKLHLEFVFMKFSIFFGLTIEDWVIHFP